MRNSVAAGAAALVCLTAPAAFAQDTGKLFFAHDLDRAVVLKVDGKPVGTVAAGAVLSVDLKAGAYTLSTEPAGGGQQGGRWTLRAEDRAYSEGSGYWCLYLDSRQVLVIVPRDQCKDFVEAPS